MEDNKFFKDSFNSMLNSYFEDLESAICIKAKLESRNKKVGNNTSKKFINRLN